MGMVTVWHAMDQEEAAALRGLDGEAIAERLEAHPPEDVLDLDKQWHAVHAVLTGDAWDTTAPRGRAVLGGEEIGDDLGYGPPRLLAADAVAEVAAELDALGRAGFSSAIDPERLAELDVYPSGVPWGDAFERQWLEDSFDQLRAFYRRAADAGRSIVIVIS